MSPLSDVKPMTVDEIYAVIDARADAFEAEALPCEQARRPTEALEALMREARIPMAKVPKAVGGCELSPMDQVDFFAKLAYVNPTASWIGFNYAGVAGLLGAVLSDEGVQALWGDGGCPLIAAVSKPGGPAKKVDGGWEISGHWQYASGVTCADYVFLFCFSDQPEGLRGALVPTDQVELVDDWHVAALKGTGSVDVKTEGLFVPDHLTATPFGQLRGGSMYTRLGLRGYIAGENVGFTLGVARRCIDEIAKLCRDKKRVLDPTTIGERGAFQHVLGRADMMLRAAHALAQSELEAAMTIANETQETIPPHAISRVDASVAKATDLAIQACHLVFPFAGAGALHESSPIQRAYRDAIGSGQHIIATNETLDLRGRAILENAD